MRICGGYVGLLKAIKSIGGREGAQISRKGRMHGIKHCVRTYLHISRMPLLEIRQSLECPQEADSCRSEQTGYVCRRCIGAWTESYKEFKK